MWPLADSSDGVATPGALRVWMLLFAVWEQIFPLQTSLLLFLSYIILGKKLWQTILPLPRSLHVEHGKAVFS